MRPGTPGIWQRRRAVWHEEVTRELEVKMDGQGYIGAGGTGDEVGNK